LDLSTLGFFAGPDPSWPHDTEAFSRSSKLLDLRTESNTGVLAAPICSLLSTNLTRLHLIFDNEGESLSKEQEEALQLLTSLQNLEFVLGYKLQRLPAGLHKFINLKTLRISYCRAIKSLPKDGLPSSMLELDVYWHNNEELRRECRKLIGTIPIVIT